MAVSIENPILNGPYDAPKRHFRFDEEGITSETVESRRCSAYYFSRSRDDGRNPGGGSSDELNVQPSWIDFARARRE